MIGGFIIEDGSRWVLIQAIGPELADRGIANALADPVLTLTKTTDPSSPMELMVNDNWEEDDDQRQLISAIWGDSLPLAPDSLSSGLVITLEPGSYYTAKVEGKDGTTGVALVEVYGIDSPDANGQFVNISTRALVETGDEVMIGGFIIEDGSRRVLIQAIGPELADRGIAKALADPVLTLTKTTDPGNPMELMVNDNWEEDDDQRQLISALWGDSLPLAPDSLSSGLVITLEPGNYTAKVEGKDGTTGVALVEVYGIDEPLPAADAPLVSINEIPAGDEYTTAQLGATLTGGAYDGPPEYAWSVSGGMLNDPSSATPTWTRPSVTANTNYTVRLTVTVRGAGAYAHNGSSDTVNAIQSALVRDTPPPLPAAEAPSVSINEIPAGDEYTTAQLGATLTGGAYDGPPEYAWSVSGGMLNDPSSATPTWTRPSVTANTNYTVRLTVTVRGAGVNAHNGSSDTANANRSTLVRAVVVGPNPDRETLMALYEAADGVNWTRSDNWGTDAPLDQWYGVFTDGSGAVTHLQLDGNNLMGSIPAELGNLADLQELLLTLNQLSGSIPPELGKLTNLQKLKLSYNQLSDVIPAELGNLADLQELWLSSNRLSGAIPPELGNLTNLTELSLFLNNFSGSIPPEFGNLRQLVYLDLIDTDLVGTVPSTLIGLPLQYFGFDSYEGLCMPGTPAFADWVAGIDLYRGDDYCNESDHAVLESLYQVMGGKDWKNADGWFEGEVPALGRWHGITADSLGRVTEIDLSDNGLAGVLPQEISNLLLLKRLRIDNNPDIGGRLPYTMPRLSLRVFRYVGTRICVPPEPFIHDWLAAIEAHEGTGFDCKPSPDREILATIYHATSGPTGWFNRENWLTDAPLREWHGVDTNAQGNVTLLDLTHNGLVGKIPPQLASLADLATLNLTGNDLSGGPIPAELGNLANLRVLDLSGTKVVGSVPSRLGRLSNLTRLIISSNKDLTGPIPAELGNLAKLTLMDLSGNSLSGPVPTELARLSNLTELHLEENKLTGSLPKLDSLPWMTILDLSSNAFSGPIPPEYGDFPKLNYLNLSFNQLTGRVPAELANLGELNELHLGGNRLSGPVPPELAGLKRLNSLVLTGNSEMSGPLPVGLANLVELSHLQAAGTKLCAPNDPIFLNWLDALLTRRVRRCDSLPIAAYLTQAAQSLDLPIALVGGEDALLRVFPTASQANSANIPRVVASFYLNGLLAHTVEIPGKEGPIPTEVDESSLARSANALIPAEVVRPGLEMVIEIDPDRTLDPGLGVARRIPEEGRQAVEVRNMPVFDITFIPFLWEKDPDSKVTRLVQEMEEAPESHPMLQQCRTLLPVADLKVTAHAPVWSSTNEASDLIRQVQAIWAMEGATNYYMGLLSGEFSGAAGIGNIGRRTAYSVTNAQVIAHEFGHNFSLPHAPCGGALGVDPAYPYPNASTGIYGYDFNGEISGTQGLVSPDEHHDLMSYCAPYWISDFTFDKALRYRLHTEGLLRQDLTTPTTSILVWGGVDSVGVPFLEPSFVFTGPPALPDSGGPHRITGQTLNGGELFSISFTMSEQCAGDHGSSFAFVIPAEPGWAEALASITLSGTGRGSFTLDRTTDLPMAIMRDRTTGQVTSFLRDPPEADNITAAVPEEGQSGSSQRILFSRGIPDSTAWKL